MKRQRNSKGQGLAEVAVISGVVMVPVMLFMFDVFFLFAANSLNDQYVKIAARAAASQSNPAGAREAAQNAISRFPISELIPHYEITHVDYREPENPGEQKVVIVQTRMDLRLPADFLFINARPVFVAKSVEPITALPPNPHPEATAFSNL